MMSLDPPCIEPSSGMYRPPILVRITHPLGAGPALPEGRLEIYYHIQRADSAEQIATGSRSSQRHRYTGPFALKYTGRVKISAVAMLINLNKNAESNMATALFVLDDNAPPPPTPGTGSIFHKTPIASPQLQTAVPSMGVTPPQQKLHRTAEKAGMSAMKAGDGIADKTGSATTKAPVSAGTGGGIQPQALQEFSMLRFVDFPDTVRSFEPFDIAMYLVDTYGYPVPSPLPLYERPKIALSADVLVNGTHSSLSGRSTTTHSPLVIAQAEGEYRPQSFTPVPWNTVTNVICGEDSTALYRSGPKRVNRWNAACTAVDLIGAEASFCGIRWTVEHSCRAIVALYNSAEAEGPLHEGTWRSLAYSIHFSADLTDPTMLPAFRLYENGSLVQTIETQDYHPGDSFAIKVRPNGNICYLRNDDIIHCSELHLHDVVGSGGRLSVQVRIAAQLSTPAITGFTLVDAESPCVFRLKGVIWHPPDEQVVPDKNTAQQAEGGGGVTAPPLFERVGVLRAWLVGYDFVPAVAKVPLIVAPIPRWAFAGASLATMFALGSLGLQGQQVAPTLKESQRKLPQISLLREQTTEEYRHQGANGNGRIVSAAASQLSSPPSLLQPPLAEIPSTSPPVTRYPSSPLNRQQRGTAYRFAVSGSPERPTVPVRGGGGAPVARQQINSLQQASRGQQEEFVDAYGSPVGEDPFQDTPPPQHQQGKTRMGGAGLAAIHSAGTNRVSVSQQQQQQQRVEGPQMLQSEVSPGFQLEVGEPQPQAPPPLRAAWNQRSGVSRAFEQVYAQPELTAGRDASWRTEEQQRTHPLGQEAPPAMGLQPAATATGVPVVGHQDPPLAAAGSPLADRYGHEYALREYVGGPPSTVEADSRWQ